MENITINLDTTIDSQLDKAKELLYTLKQCEDKSQALQFITIKDFSKATGWSLKTVQDVFNRKDFPCSDFGKEKVALLSAVIKYFEVPRRR